RDTRTDDFDGIRTPGISGRAAAVLLLTAEAATVRRTRPAINVCVHTPAHVKRREERRRKTRDERETERESGARDVLGPGSLHVAQGRLDVPTDGTTTEEAMTYGSRNLPLTVRTVIPFRCNIHVSRTIPAQNSDSCISNHGSVLVGGAFKELQEREKRERSREHFCGCTFGGIWSHEQQYCLASIDPSRGEVLLVKREEVVPEGRGRAMGTTRACKDTLGPEGG
ncbi:hypothetical protein ALC56_00577, partial [Trachymyrmex septentrionalis]